MESPDLSQRNKVGELLTTNTLVKIAEIASVAFMGYAAIKIFEPTDKNNLVQKQASVWIAYILMIALVWLGIKLRKQNWSDLGLTFERSTFKEAGKTFLLSLLVFVLGVTGFVLGSIIMANITGIPEGADMSGYEYLQNNPLMLILTLLGVYIVSSFGEEVLFRAFLINRVSEIGASTKTARIIAVLLSAIIFGLAHYEWGPMGIVQTGCMGLAFGICYLKLKKRLWILILAHAYMDTILMVQMYLTSN